MLAGLLPKLLIKAPSRYQIPVGQYRLAQNVLGRADRARSNWHCHGPLSVEKGSILRLSLSPNGFVVLKLVQ